MEPGIYKLTRDVENPQKVDRRRNDWWLRPVLKKGVIVLRSDREFDFDEPVPSIALPGEIGTWSWQSIRRHAALVAAMEKACERVDHTKNLEMVLRYYREIQGRGVSFKKILQTLIVRGDTSIEDIIDICEASK
jgi:hypothetical protein